MQEPGEPEEDPSREAVPGCGRGRSEGSDHRRDRA